MGLGVSGQNICCHVAALNDRLLKKLNFDPRVGGGGGVRGLWTKYLLLCCCICDSIEFNIQHDHVQKKVNF